MKNLLKISLLLFVFGLTSHLFSQDIKTSETKEPAKRAKYDPKKNKAMKKSKVTHSSPRRNSVNKEKEVK